MVSSPPVTEDLRSLQDFIQPVRQLTRDPAYQRTESIVNQLSALQTKEFQNGITIRCLTGELAEETARGRAAGAEMKARGGMLGQLQRTNDQLKVDLREARVLVERRDVELAEARERIKESGVCRVELRGEGREKM